MMRRRSDERVGLDLHGLTGHEAIFRVAAGTTRDPAVERWLHGDAGELRAIAKEWFAQLRDCGDDVVEGMHDRCPVACIGDAPFAYVNAFKRHVNVGFFYGALLDDPAGLLTGTGKRMRHVAVRPGVAIDVEGLRALIRAAYVDIKQRLDAEGFY